MHVCVYKEENRRINGFNIMHSSGSVHYAKLEIHKLTQLRPLLHILFARGCEPARSNERGLKTVLRTLKHVPKIATMGLNSTPDSSASFRANAQLLTPLTAFGTLEVVHLHKKLALKSGVWVSGA